MLRVTQIIAPLHGTTFEDIPDWNLEPAREFGVAGHKDIEDYLKGVSEARNSNILFMFKQAQSDLGLGLTPPFDVETRLYSDGDDSIAPLAVTGRPDYFDAEIMADWKFTSAGLRNETALQLVSYDCLAGGASRRCLAFQFDKDASLRVFELNPDATPDLLEFFDHLRINSESLAAGDVAVYEAKEAWDDIQYKYELFTLLKVYYPPLKIDDYDMAVRVAQGYGVYKAVGDDMARANDQLKLFMAQEGIKSIEYPGGMVSLQESTCPQFKIPKDVKEQYKTGTKDIIKLVNRKEK